MATQVFNYVSFTSAVQRTAPVEGLPNEVSLTPRIYLTLEEDWTFTPGLEPSVNAAIIPCTEFDKLGGNLVDVVGRVEFWFHQSPDLDTGKPDASYKQIRLVDVEATKFGILGVSNPRTKILTSSEVARPLEYRLTFADVREQWVWPRGGTLTQGEINKEPFDEATSLDANGNPVLDLYDLTVRCVEAMGLSDSIVPEQLIGVEAPTNLEWRANHAPTELKKLLAAGQCVFTLSIAGDAAIQQIGVGAAPGFPQDQRLPVYSVPTIDRRGKTVVFTSAPNSNLATEFVNGFHRNGKETWQFVIQDKDGVWTPIADAPFWGGVGPVASLKQHFKNVDVKYRQRVADQAYRCLRLNPAVYGPAPILRHLIGGGMYGPLEVRANIAQQYVDGYWSDSTVLIDVAVAHLLDGEILVLSQRLGRVGYSPVTDPDQAFMPLTDDDLTIRLTREVFDQAADGTWKPQFFNVGFRQDLGTIKQLTEDELKLVLAGPEPTIVRRPDWILVTLDGKELYRAEIGSAAKVYAARYLRGSGSVSQICTARGFAAVELDGVVSEVRINQKNAITTAKTNTWWLPSGDNYADVAELDKPPSAGEKFPAQNHTAAAKTAAGQSGAVQPSVPVLPAPPTSAVASEVLVQITGNAAGGGKYLGGLVSGRSTAKPAPDEVMPEGMTPPVDFTVLIVNLREDGEHGHRLPVGYYVGKLVGGADGPIVVIDSDRCGATSPMNLGSSDPINTVADNTSVEDADRKLVYDKRITRIAYDGSADAVLYAFYRVYRLACGHVTDISGETKVPVVATDLCDPGDA